MTLPFSSVHLPILPTLEVDWFVGVVHPVCFKKLYVIVLISFYELLLKYCLLFSSFWWGVLGSVFWGGGVGG